MASNYTEVLAPQGVQAEALVYSAENVQVFKGRYRGEVCAVKIQRLMPNGDWNELAKECNLLMTLQHERILKVWHCFWGQAAGAWVLCIVTEWKTKDLMKDVADRKKQLYCYTEEELWTYLKQAVSALAYLQQHHIAHRDIKPQNIFLAAGQLTIGDFGSARVMQNSCSYTLVGTPFFLSPQLKQALVMRQTQCSHDPVKSDVYSLGLTFLTMMCLEAPMSLAMATHAHSEILGSILAPLQYSEPLKSWITLMCAYDEGERCDFLYIDSFLNPVHQVLDEIPQHLCETAEKWSSRLLEEKKEESVDMESQETVSVKSVTDEGEEVTPGNEIPKPLPEAAAQWSSKPLEEKKEESASMESRETVAAESVTDEGEEVTPGNEIPKPLPKAAAQWSSRPLEEKKKEPASMESREPMIIESKEAVIYEEGVTPGNEIPPEDFDIIEPDYDGPVCNYCQKECKEEVLVQGRRYCSVQHFERTVEEKLMKLFRYYMNKFPF